MNQRQGAILLGFALLWGIANMLLTPNSVPPGHETVTTTAIVMLLSNRQEDIDDALFSIRSMEPHLPPTVPMLIFNEGNLSQQQSRALVNSTSRVIKFPLVNFSEFPMDFSPKNVSSHWTKRSPWGYQQMCRFWSTKLWEHEALDNYTTIMRMDSDSCLVGPLPKGLPKLPSGVVYAANSIQRDTEQVSAGIWDLAEAHVKQHKLTPKNKRLWRMAKLKWARRRQMPTFYTNFEVSRLDFFRRDEVMDFLETITEKPPYGVFHHRWGDAIVRFLTIAIFAEPHQLYQPNTKRFYRHFHGCNARPEVAKPWWQLIFPSRLVDNWAGNKSIRGWRNLVAGILWVVIALAIIRRFLSSR
jgi:hypothetical protein